MSKFGGSYEFVFAYDCEYVSEDVGRELRLLENINESRNDFAHKCFLLKLFENFRDVL